MHAYGDGSKGESVPTMRMTTVANPFCRNRAIASPRRGFRKSSGEEALEGGAGALADIYRNFNTSFEYRNREGGKHTHVRELGKGKLETGLAEVQNAETGSTRPRGGDGPPSRADARRFSR